MITEQDIMLKLKMVIDPELNMNIVDLGLVYETEVIDDKIKVIMTLTAPGCPLAPMIEGQVRDVLLSFKDINDVDVQIVFDPPWNPSMMSDEAKLNLGFDI